MMTAVCKLIEKKFLINNGFRYGPEITTEIHKLLFFMSCEQMLGYPDMHTVWITRTFVKACFDVFFFSVTQYHINTVRRNPVCAKPLHLLSKLILWLYELYYLHFTKIKMK